MRIIGVIFMCLAMFTPAWAERTLSIDGTRTEGTLRRFWQVSNFGKPGGRSFTGEGEVERLYACAPFARQVVVDYALGGHRPDSEEYYLGQGPDGELRTDFKSFINRIRMAVDAGLTPWIGLENVPPLMSDPVNWSVYGNSEPAVDNDLFQRYVTLAIEACIEEFGREEMARWKFIVATEPDLNPAHWTGTKEEFLDLLDHTLMGVFDVFPEANISPGNILRPAPYYKPRQQTGDKAVSLTHSRDQWGLDIIDHMAAGSINPGNGPGSKMDFFSFSWYGRIGASPDTLDDSVRMIRERLAPYPQYKDIPIDVREFGILVDENRHRLYAGDASEWGASFYAAIARKVYDLDIRYVFEWDSATRGVLHPRGQVICMLEKMAGGESLQVELKEANSEARCNAIAARKDGKVFVLVFNHHDQRHHDPVETVHLEICDPLFADSETCSLKEWTIDKDHAKWIHAFIEDAAKAGYSPIPKSGMFEGSPYRLLGEDGFALFDSKIERYRELSQLPQTCHEKALPLRNGRLQIDLKMPSHSVRLIELVP